MNKLIEFRGQLKTANQWAKDLGMSKGTVSHRLNAGWTVERALTTPVDAALSAKKGVPSKTDAMRWLDERPVKDAPKCFQTLLKGYTGTKMGMHLRANHLPEFIDWFENEYKPKIHPTISNE